MKTSIFITLMFVGNISFAIDNGSYGCRVKGFLDYLDIFYSLQITDKYIEFTEGYVDETLVYKHFFGTDKTWTEIKTKKSKKSDFGIVSDKYKLYKNEDGSFGHDTETVFDDGSKTTTSKIFKMKTPTQFSIQSKDIAAGDKDAIEAECELKITPKSKEITKMPNPLPGPQS